PLAPWAANCPATAKPPGNRRPARPHKGSKWLDAALKDPPPPAIRTDNSSPQALYRRKKPQLGHGRAIGAVKHSIICACWHMLTTGEIYNDLGGDYFSRRDPERQTRRLVAQLERLGNHVTLQTPASPAHFPPAGRHRSR